MCIAWGALFSRPFASSVTEAVLPFKAMEALPVPVTWFVGTGFNGPAVAPAAAPLDDFLSEEPEPRAITATMPATSARPAAMGHRRPIPRRFSEAACGGGPGGGWAGGGWAGGGGGGGGAGGGGGGGGGGGRGGGGGGRGGGLRGGRLLRRGGGGRGGRSGGRDVGALAREDVVRLRGRDGEVGCRARLGELGLRLRLLLRHGLIDRHGQVRGLLVAGVRILRGGLGDHLVERLYDVGPLEAGGRRGV